MILFGKWDDGWSFYTMTSLKIGASDFHTSKYVCETNPIELPPSDSVVCFAAEPQSNLNWDMPLLKIRKKRSACKICDLHI